MSQTRLSVLTFLVAVFLLFAQLVYADELARFAGLKGALDIAGGTAHIPVMKEAAKRIMGKYPDIRITVAGGGSGVGVQQVGEGLAAIGNTGRALSPEEISKYGLKTFPFAIDGVALVTHPSNPVAKLTAEQARKIYAGEIKNWKELGGEDAVIDLFTRDEASGTREVFWEKLLKKGAIVDSANVVASNGAMKTAVSQDKKALGYVGIGHVDQTVKAPLLDEIQPSQENAANGKYPISRKLYMNTKGDPNPLAKAFIEYILGPDGQAISKQNGYIPLQ
jgi:phosphate transport system substrate-binding protein